MLIAAEIGLNHDGNLDLACEMVRQAKAAGADIAKFQFGWRAGDGELNAIDLDRARLLRRWCDHVGIEMLASVFDDAGYELAKAVGLRRYKIASRTVNDAPGLCKRVIADGKPCLVSLGMWTGATPPFGPPRPGELEYVYCRSKYPAAPWDLEDFPARFDDQGFFGYSDHCLGIEACILAVARGARYVEKHFTLGKSSQVIRDHTLSATPDELRRLVEVAKPLSALVNVLRPAHAAASEA